MNTTIHTIEQLMLKAIHINIDKEVNDNNPKF